MEVTFRPVILSRRPVEDAASGISEENASGACETRTDDALADTTDDASRDENVLHCTIETRSDRQRQEQAATWEGANRKSTSSLNTQLNQQPKCHHVRQRSRTPLTTRRTFRCRRVHCRILVHAALCLKRSVLKTRWTFQPSRHSSLLAGANHQHLDLPSRSRAQNLRG